MIDDSSIVRRTVLFSGRVQGVGFRFTTESIARRFPVTGYVRNLPDGRVELMAEGRSEDMDRFLAAVREAMSENIATLHAVDSPASGTYSSFRIAR